MYVSKDFQAGDHLHSIAFDNDTPVPVTGFDFDAVDAALGNESEPEKPVEFSDMAAAFSLILAWICNGSGNDGVASRAYTLGYFLDPGQSRFNSLQEIADACGMSRQGCSKALMELRDDCGLALCFGKREFARESYSRAQKASFANGDHSAFKRHDLKSRKQTR